MVEQSVSTSSPKAHVIIVGNEKGGSGKTTTSMHLIVSLLRLGFKVGSMDIDARQRSLTRYIENRRGIITKEGVDLPLPNHVVVQRSPFNVVQEAEADERERFSTAIERLCETNDFVVIDSPGSDTYLARLAHSFADTILTPINDSFVDLDVLANVDGNTLKILRPSIYSEMVWEQKLHRAKRDNGSIDWIVMRNRLSNIDARNKRFMTKVVSELSRRIGFRIAPGFSERVIFREMFLQGLTVLDVIDTSANVNISMSHVAARQEVRELLRALKIPAIENRINEVRASKGPASPEAAKASASDPVTDKIAAMDQASMSAAIDKVSDKVTTVAASTPAKAVAPSSATTASQTAEPVKPAAATNEALLKSMGDSRPATENKITENKVTENKTAPQTAAAPPKPVDNFEMIRLHAKANEAGI
jgi:chromosome partitioning protein